MVRNYKRKTGKGPTPDFIRRAVDHFFTSTDGIKKTSLLFGVPKSTLRDNTHTNLHTHAHTHTHIHTHIQTNIHTHTYTHTNTDTHTHIHTH